MLEKLCTVRYLVVVGVEILDDVDADDDVETELDVDTLKAKRKIISVRNSDDNCFGAFVKLILS